MLFLHSILGFYYVSQWMPIVLLIILLRIGVDLNFDYVVAEIFINRVIRAAVGLRHIF